MRNRPLFTPITVALGCLLLLFGIAKGQTTSTTTVTIDHDVVNSAPSPSAKHRPPASMGTTPAMEVIGGSGSLPEGLQKMLAERDKAVNIGQPYLPEMYELDPAAANWRDAVVYLNFEGASGLTYNGPETVEGIAVHAYEVPAYLNLERQQAIEATVDALRNLFFPNTGVTFVTTAPQSGNFSTVHIGGTGDEFRQYGHFIGLAEHVDIGNEVPNDIAFVFSENIPVGAADGTQYVTGFAQTIAHEVGRLLGFAEVGEKIERGRPQSWSDVNLNLVEVEVDGQTSTSSSGSFDVDQNKEIYLYSRFKNYWSGNGGVNTSLDYFSGTPIAYSWTGNAGKAYYAPGSTIWHKNGYTISSSDPMVEGYEDGWGNYTWETETLGFKVNTNTDSWFEFQTRAWVDTTYVPSSGPNDQQGYDVYVYDIYPQAPDTTDPTKPGNPDLDASDDSGYRNYDNITSNDDLDFTWAASSDASGIAGYWWELNDSSPDNWQSGTGTSLRINNISEGTHTLYIESEDNAGNRNTSASSLTFIVDKQGPYAPETNGPTGMISDTTPRFDWYTATDRGDAGIYQYELLVVSDTLGITKLHKYLTGTEYTPTSGESLPEEGLKWRVRAQDKAGKWGDWCNYQYFTIYNYGTLTATLKNVVGSNAPAAGVRFLLYTSPTKQVSGSNPVTISDITPGTYLLEGYQNGGTPFGEEFWSSDNVTISGGSNSKTLTRNYPYGYNFKAYNGNGEEIAPGGPLRLGDQVRVEVTVKNSVPSTSLNAYVRLLLDRNQASSYDFDQTSSAQSISGSGGTKTFTFYYTPASTGLFHHALEIKTYIAGSSSWVRTDSWNWSQSFTVDGKNPTTPGTPDMLSTDDSMGKSNSDNITNDTSIRFDWSGSSDASGIKGYWWAVDDSTPETGGTFTANRYCTGVNPAEGNRRIYVKAVDNAGNIGSASYLDFVIDRTALLPPTFSSPSENASVDLAQPVTLKWQSVSGAWRYKAYVREDGLLYLDARESGELSATEWQVSPSLTVKNWGWQVKVQDVAGNWGSYGKNGIVGVWGHFGMFVKREIAGVPDYDQNDYTQWNAGGICVATSSADIMGYWDRSESASGVNYWNLIDHGIAPLFDALNGRIGSQGDVSAVVDYVGSRYYPGGTDTKKRDLLQEFCNTENGLNFTIDLDDLQTQGVLWEHMKQEINSGRPVMWGIEMALGGHSLPVIGYLESASKTDAFVHVNLGGIGDDWVDWYGGDGYDAEDIVKIIPGGTPEDHYESDNSSDEANPIDPESTYAFRQTHNFITSGDVDWIKWTAQPNRKYSVVSTNFGSQGSTKITVYREGELSTPFARDTDGGTAKLFAPTLTARTFYIKVENGNSNSGPHTNYDIEVDYDDLTVIPLTSGSGVAGSVQQADWTFYSITVPAGIPSLELTTTNATADVDLYVKVGDLPSTESGYYDWRGYTSSGNETITLSSPTAGIYYIGVHGYEAGSFSVKATMELPAGTVQFKSSTYSVNEDGGSIRIYVSRTGGSFGAASVNYGTANGTAVAGADYTAKSGVLNWSNGESGDKDFDVPITNDSEAENAETFTASLSGASGAGLGSPSSTTVTINGPNDQPAGTVQFKSSTYSVDEDGGSIRIYVSRTVGSYGAASVNYATANGSATAGLDYTSQSGQLTWSDGDAADKYFDVPITNDSTAENAETFTASLSGASGASLGSPSSTGVTIQDNESPPATSFLVTTQNAGTEQVGTPFSVILTAKDGEGNTAIGYEGSKIINWSWTATNSPNDIAPTKPADGPVSFNAGVATVEGFTLVKTGETPTIIASDGTISGTSGIITVTHANATKLVFTQQPGGGTAGSAWATQPMVEIQDDYGNTITTDDTTQVTVTIDSNPGGGTLSGTDTVMVSAGVATFTGLSVDRVGTGYTLAATSDSLATVRSDTFNITAGAKSKIVFLTPSQTINAGESSAVMTIQTQDEYNNPANVTSGTIINLSSTLANGKFSLSVDPWEDLTSVTISKDFNSANFYYKDTIAGTPTITAAESPDRNWADATQVETIEAAADLKITKNDSSDPAPAGGYLTYTVTVTNKGPSDAANVTLTDNLPSQIQSPEYSTDGGESWNQWTGSLELGTIGAEDSKQVLIRGTVTSIGTIINTASVSSSTTDPDLNNNSANQETTVSPSPGVLSVTPSYGLPSSGTEGGPFSPSSKTYTLKNAGGSSIDWTASKNQSWVDLSKTSGTLEAGATDTVTVSINSYANSLNASNYNDTVSFTNTTNGAGDTTRSVSLTVNPVSHGTITVNPDPDSVNAQWTLTGPDGYNYSGNGDESVSNLDPGDYTLTWDSIGGLVTPSPNPETKNLPAGGSITFAGTYTELPEFISNTDTITVPEGGTAEFQLKLNAGPAGTVEATVAWLSGDTDIIVQSGGTLNFDSSNWDTYQTVILAAEEDQDSIDGEATIRVSADGIPDKDITATEADNDVLLREAIVYDREGDIYVAKTDGSDETQLTSGDPVDSMTSLSPDGTTVAFSRDGNLYLMNQDGTNQRLLVIKNEVGNNSVHDSDWTLDGEWIFFNAVSGCCSGGLYMVRPDGTDLSLVRSGYITQVRIRGSLGDRVIFNQRRNSLSYSQNVRITDMDGANEEQVTSGGPSESSATFGPCWSPDGQRFAYNYGHEHIYVYSYPSPYNPVEIKTFESWNAHNLEWLDNETLIWVDGQNSNRMHTINIDTLAETDLGINGTNPYVGRYGIANTYYEDVDGDGYGNPDVTAVASTQPPGYVTNSDDCNDSDANEHPGQTWYKDSDGDGYSDGVTDTTSCTRPAGYKVASELTATSGDCDDSNASVYSGATEVCNGIDDDCDSQVDEGVKSTYYRDADGDGYGDPLNTTQDCTQPADYVTDNTDCDDSDANEHPNQIWYKDSDGDGYSDGVTDTNSCTRPLGYKLSSELSATSGDCDDSNASVYPGVTEVCNGIDDDCDSQVDEGVKITYYLDADGDSYGDLSNATQDCTQPAGYVTNNADCDDSDANEHPGQTWYKDADGDGCSDGVTDTTSCTRPAGYKIASELTAIFGDCDDDNANVHPDAMEVCNDMDDDCDGQVDEQCDVNRPPVLDPIRNKTVGENELLEFVVTATDPDGDTLTFSASNLPTDASFDSSTQTFTWTPGHGDDGNYFVLFTVTDDGTPPLSDFEIVTITVGDVNRPPVLDPIGDKTVDEGALLEFTITGTDPEGNGLAYSASNIPTGASFDSSIQTFGWETSFGDAGNYNVLFTVTDDGSPPMSDFETVTITVGDVNRPPVLNPIGNKRVEEDELLEFTITASDPDGDTLTFSVSNLPTDANFDSVTQTFNWAPAYEDAGNYDVLFTVTDDGSPPLSDFETVTITVGDINRPPLLNPIGNKTVDEDELLEFIVTATDPDGNALTYSVGNLPPGANFDTSTQTFSWMPSFEDTGNYYILFTVTDDDSPPLSDSETVTITVGDVNRPPVLNLIGTKRVEEGELLEFTITATDPDGDILTYSASNLPAGANFDPVTQTFRWIPGYDEADNYYVMFTVIDDSAEPLSDTETVTITVDEQFVSNLSVTKTDDRDPVESGENSTYTITITNNGQDPARGVTLIDTLPGETTFVSANSTQGICNNADEAVSCDIGNMANGATVTVSIVITTPNAAGIVTNTATVSCTNLDPDNTNDTASEDTTVCLMNTYYQDADGDGYGDPNNTTQDCSRPSGYVTENTDCDDSDENEHPGQTWYKDADGDGYSDGVTDTTSCTRPAGYKVASELTATSGDCDDGNANIHPGAVEICNGVDDDCDGQVDEGVKNTYYRDADGDGYGDPNNTTQDCMQPSDYVADNTDCDDSDANEHPNQTWYKDSDGDGYSDGVTDTTSCTRLSGYKVASELTAISGDCDDGNANIHPGAVEICNNNVDDDCDGQVDEGVTYYQDADEDGYGDPLNTTQDCTQPAGYVADNTDCDDSDADEHPGQTWYKDADGDGYSDGVTDTTSCTRPAGYKVVSELTATSGDCDDGNANINPAAEEVFNDVDDNCDGQVDEQCDVNWPPVLDLIGNRTISEDELLEFYITATDQDGDALTYSASNLPIGSSFDPVTQVFSWTPVDGDAGNYYVLFTVTDDGSPPHSDSETVTITVGDVNHPPVLDPIGNKTIDEDEYFEFIIAATDQDGNTLTFSASNLLFGASFDPVTQVFSWTTSFWDIGNYYVLFTVTDDGSSPLSDSETVTITVGDVNRPPILDPIGNKRVEEDELLEFTITATDPDCNALTFSASDLPTVANIDPSTQTFSWTSGYEDAGNYDVLFTVTDDGSPPLNDSETVTITVGNINRPPVLNPIGTKRVEEGKLLEFTITATDPDGNELTYSASDLPADANFDHVTQVFSWTPGGGDVGSYKVIFTVTDDVEIDTEEVRIIVTTEDCLIKIGDQCCLIAVAAYGSPLEPHVIILREFRDRFLIVNTAGKRFVRFYYTYSPPIADFIAEHDSLRAVVRVILLPFVGVSLLALNIGLIPALVFMLMLLTLISVTAIILFRKRGLRKHRKSKSQVSF